MSTATTQNFIATETENGMPAFSTSGRACLDYFGVAGALRSEEEEAILSQFRAAFREDRLTAVRTAFWARDVRGGQGQRRPFRIILKHLAVNFTGVVEKNIHLISEYGRWDDILTLLDTPAEATALDQIGKALSEGDGLCAKWLPRKGPIANKIRKHLKLSPKEYRKKLVSLTRVVESLMCARQWGAINYEHVPSVASKLYAKAFGKRDGERYSSYLADVKSGEKKIHAGAIYPYDIIRSLSTGNVDTADAQWAALPNYMGDVPHSIIPVCDSSGSMSCLVTPGSKLSCLDVCISLGIHISERNLGPFRDKFITFSSRPEMHTLTGTLSQRHNQIARSHWEMTTNLLAVFSLILDTLAENPSADSPDCVLIISDMQFNGAVEAGNHAPAFAAIKNMYATAGRTPPKVIFWQVNGKMKNTPVRFTDEGVAIVSGFSPSILVNILRLEGVDPMSLLADTVHSERYAPILV